MVLAVFVQPRAARDAIGGEYRGALKIKTRALPADGKANAAICVLIAEWLDVPKSSVAVVSGHSSRAKRVSIGGVSQAELQKAVQLVLSSGPHEPG